MTSPVRAAVVENATVRCNAGCRRRLSWGVITDLDETMRSFETFVRRDGPRLRRVLAARYGIDIGVDAADAALAWAWEHWDRVGTMANPAGYLYRVAQTRARRALERGELLRFPTELGPSVELGSVMLDRDLSDALAGLSEQQRMAVLLVHAFGWTPAEVGQFLGVPAVTVRSHVRRGLRRLRTLLTQGELR